MKKNLFNYLSILFIVLVCSFGLVGIVVAADTIKVGSVSSYSDTNAHHRVLTDGRNAWCMNKDKGGPGKGTKMSLDKTYTSGHYIYILNHGNPGGTSKKDILTIQNALWMGRHYNNASGSSAVPSSWAYYKEGKALWEAAKKAGSGWVPTPTAAIISAPGALTYTNDGFYTSKAVGVSLNNTANKNYTVTFTGNVPAGASVYNTAGARLGGSGVTISDPNFLIKVPVNSVAQNYAFNVNVTGPYTTYVNVAKMYCKKNSKGNCVGDMQHLLTYNTAGSAPVAATSASIQPIFVKITKHDEETNQPLAGAQYRVFKNQDCTGDVEGFTGTYTTDANGVATIVNIPAGTYYVKEVAAPAGYALSSNSCLPASTSGTVAAFKNKKNNVVIYKHDLSGNLIDSENEGVAAEFAIFNNASCSKPATYDGTTTEIPHALAVHGVVKFEKMAAINPDTGSNYYYIKEMMPPKGYALPTTQVNCVRVQVNGTVTFKDAKIGEKTISVQKRDGFTHFGINDVRIGLFSDNACANVLQEAVPTKNGYVTFTVECPEDRSCTFYVKEMATPDGYVPKKGKDKAECIEVKTGAGVSASGSSAIIDNMPYGNIKLLKLDATTDKPLSGVEFALLDKDKKPAKDIEGKEVANKKTDENGNIEFTDIMYGTYYLQEISNDGTHKVIKDPVKFELSSATDSLKLARNGGGMYYLGDANGDTHITEADLTAYQSYISDFDSVAGLSHNIKLALNIDYQNDSDLSVDVLKKNMNILKLYLQYVNSGNADVYTAAKSYNKDLADFCQMVGDANCSVDNLEAINSLYDLHTRQNQEFQRDLDTLPTRQEQWEQAKARYDQALEEYNAHCNVETNEVTVDPDESSDQGEDGYDCSAPISVPNPGPQPSYDTICEEHPMMADYDNNCKVDDADLDLLNAAIEAASHDVKYDLNGDGEVNNSDNDVLNRYLEFSTGGNTTAIMTLIDKILDNKNVLCSTTSGERCVIDRKNLGDALTDVGKRYYIPSNIAQASIFLKDEVITMKISKFQISKSKEIPGAKIIIRDSKNNKIMEYVSGKEPKEFNIPAGKYTLTEKVAPKGYKNLTTVISFEVDKYGAVKLTGAKSNLYTIKKGTDNHLIIYNELIKNEKVVVPDTGSNASILAIIAGVLLVSGGGYILYKKVH